MPTAVPASISVNNLAKSYGPVEAVRDVCFELHPGEIFGLLGQNGAGKTTTIECLLGLRQPDAGTITIQGINVLTEPIRARQRVGAQLQYAALQHKITPAEALQFSASFYPKPANTDSLLTQFDLTAKARAPFDSLSSGQKQRLFLALALVNNPEILVLDEPTAGLDPQSRRELHQIIAGLRAAGQTVLLSTHNLEEASSLCDQIGILHEGRIIANATPAALIARSSAIPRVSFRTARPLDAVRVATLPGVANHSQQGIGWLVSTSDVNQTINSLVRELTATGNEMLDLHIQRPSLEDVFIELTGKTWSETKAEETP
jgi:ABC-2 type transport system ATP-binding protein